MFTKNILRMLVYVGVACETDLVEISNTSATLWYKYCALTDNRLRCVNIHDQINPMVSKYLAANNRVACRGFYSSLKFNSRANSTHFQILLQFWSNLDLKGFLQAGVWSFAELCANTCVPWLLFS